MAKKIEINQALCIGCGSCVSACPECFEMGEDGKSKVKEEYKDNCCDLDEIVVNCPVQAIDVKEE